MTATETVRLTPNAGVYPARGTYPIAADTLIKKGWQVALDTNGRAVPAGTIASGALVGIGKASATFDNTGGDAGDMDVQVEYGVFGYFSAAGGGDDIAADDVRKTAFLVDNQTVALTSNAGARGIAGIITEVRDGLVWVYQGPHVAGLIAIAASEVSDVDSLQADAVTANAIMRIPLTSFLDADGDPLAKFVSAGSPTFGFNLADSEALNLRWNNDATPGTALCQIALPPDLDDTAAAQLEFLCSKSGATVGDATTLTITAFIIAAGDLHDADANAGGVTGALVGNAAAKTTALLSLTIAAADIPASARSMTFTVTPTAGTLGTDDLMIHDVRLRYKRKLLAS